MSNLLVQDTLGAVSSLTNYNDNLDAIEDSLGAFGYFVVSGLVPSAGTGLSVNVTAGTALVAGLVTVSAGFSIGGLTPSTTNHLYLNQNGTGTSNTTGTQPALTTKLGTATTDGTGVTAVNVLRSGGRQALVRPENQVAGDPGSMGSIDLSDWNATAANGFQVTGVLPSGAIGGLGPSYLWNFTAPVMADFSWVNQGSATISDTPGGNYLATIAEAGPNLRVRVKTAPATPYTITTAFIPSLAPYNGPFPECGILFRESATGKIITWSYMIDTQIPYIRPRKWTSATAFSADYIPGWDDVSTFQTGPFIWQRIRNDNTQLFFDISNDGRTWYALSAQAKNDFFTTAPDQVGFFVHAHSNTYPAAMWLTHWAQT